MVSCARLLAYAAASSAVGVGSAPSAPPLRGDDGLRRISAVLGLGMVGSGARAASGDFALSPLRSTHSNAAAVGR
jgi:hypothetical protein